VCGGSAGGALGAMGAVDGSARGRRRAHDGGRRWGGGRHGECFACTTATRNAGSSCGPRLAQTHWAWSERRADHGQAIVTRRRDCFVVLGEDCGVSVQEVRGRSLVVVVAELGTSGCVLGMQVPGQQPAPGYSRCRIQVEGSIYHAHFRCACLVLLCLSAVGGQTR
jgi:hypothetical protein